MLLRVTPSAEINILTSDKNADKHMPANAIFHWNRETAIPNSLFLHVSWALCSSYIYIWLYMYIVIKFVLGRLTVTAFGLERAPQVSALPCKPLWRITCLLRVSQNWCRISMVSMLLVRFAPVPCFNVFPQWSTTIGFWVAWHSWRIFIKGFWNLELTWLEEAGFSIVLRFAGLFTPISKLKGLQFSSIFIVGNL